MKNQLDCENDDVPLNWVLKCTEENLVDKLNGYMRSCRLSALAFIK